MLGKGVCGGGKGVCGGGNGVVVCIYVFYLMYLISEMVNIFSG